MALHITLTTGNILVVEDENIPKFQKQFASGASFIEVDAVCLDGWNVYDEPEPYTINTKYIVMFKESESNR